MQFVTDTCFWTHVCHLFTQIRIDLRSPLNAYLWGITTAVQEELLHFNLEEFVPFKNANLIPITHAEFDRFLIKYPHLREFDHADISVLYAAQRDGNIILTDDGGVYLEAVSMKLAVLYLPDWCLYLVRDAGLAKHECAKILRFWEENGVYSRLKLKKWKQALILL